MQVFVQSTLSQDSAHPLSSKQKQMSTDAAGNPLRGVYDSAQQKHQTMAMRQPTNLPAMSPTMSPTMTQLKQMPRAKHLIAAQNLSSDSISNVPASFDGAPSSKIDVTQHDPTPPLRRPFRLDNLDMVSKSWDSGDEEQKVRSPNALFNARINPRIPQNKTFQTRFGHQ